MNEQWQSPIKIKYMLQFLVLIFTTLQFSVHFYYTTV